MITENFLTYAQTEEEAVCELRLKNFIHESQVRLLETTENEDDFRPHELGIAFERHAILMCLHVLKERYPSIAPIIDQTLSICPPLEIYHLAPGLSNDEGREQLDAVYIGQATKFLYATNEEMLD